MRLPIFQVDAFSSLPFAGNPAAVCLLDETIPDALMQKIAIEMNLSETAFVLPEGEDHRLRWFTPVAEVDICGHATLASAFVLWEQNILAKEREARFSTRSGILRAFRREMWIELDFPARPASPIVAPDGLTEAIGVSPTFVAKFRDDYLLEVASEAAVQNLTPDFARLALTDARAVMVTSRATRPGFDFISRFFAPKMGVDEDPVTGAAHCVLAPHWGRILGKTEMTAYQASARGGIVRVRLGDERVFISGCAVLVSAGELRI